jgi:azurin
MDATHDSHETGGFWTIGNLVLALGFAAFAGISAASLIYSGFLPPPAAPAATSAPAAAASAPAAPVAAATSAPANAAAAGPVDSIVIKPSPVNPLMYDTSGFTVKTGKSIEVTFNNDSTLPQPHNFILCKVGTKDAVLKLATDMLSGDPNAYAKGYIPTSPDIIIHTKLLNPKESQTLKFDAPAPGDYPYFCSFPGHAILMNGVMKVVP